MSNDLAIFACLPLCDFKETPKDQSKSELFDCPKCKQKMWLSEKKKGLILFFSGIGKEILLCCYHCIKKYAQDNREDFLSAKKVEI